MTQHAPSFWEASIAAQGLSSVPRTQPTSLTLSRWHVKPDKNSLCAAVATATRATVFRMAASCSISQKMQALQIDPEQRTAWVETGLTAAAVTMAAAAHGLAIGFGDTGSVGVGGITLGGGVGYLVRKVRSHDRLAAGR